MRNFCILLTVLFSCLDVYGQSIADLTRMAEEKKNPLSAFEFVGDFYNRLAIARKQSEEDYYTYYGVIDEYGNVYVPFVYDDLSIEKKNFNYYDNIYKCRKNGKYGFVNSEGTEILPCKYSSLENAGSRWYKAIRDGKYGYVFMNGSKKAMTEVIPCVYDRLEVYPNEIIYATYKGLKGVVNIENKTIVPFDFSYISDPHNNKIWVEKDGKVGLYDLQGKELQACDIEEVFVYADNKPTTVSYQTKPEFPDNYIYIVRNGMMGIMDSCCNTIVPCEYQYIAPFVKNKTLCKNNGKWGIIENTGRIIQPCSFKEIFSNGDIVIKGEIPVTVFSTYLYVRDENKWGMLSSEGETFIDVKYDSLGCFREERLLAKTGSMYGYINPSGQKVTPFIYTYASDFSEGLAAVMTDKDKYFFINQHGDMVIKPQKYDKVGMFVNGTCEVSKHGKVWRIDKQGKKVKESKERVDRHESKPKERTSFLDYIRSNVNYNVRIQQNNRRPSQPSNSTRSNVRRTTSWRGR